MVKRVLSLLMLLCAVFTMSAQELPLNPKVLTGKLPNGLTYYILHNEEPKGRANFYIAQKVGSTLETDAQLGLAHFLEHMAFNGSKNFPGKSMLEYLQHKGIRFGADINAYTAFDETVYNINNVPTNDQALMDSVLLVLHDWSCDLSLEDAEIDAERGVIQGEARQRNDAGNRMNTALLPQLFEEKQYQQMPIGSMEIVANFPYKDLRDYYEKWYRPDQQGIVVVGDFDAKAMEQKVIALFSTIEMPENAAERTYPPVSDNKDLIYATFEDPEIQQPMALYFLKMDKVPFEQRNSLEYYVSDVILENLITSMINERLGELAQKADCPYVMASTYFGDYYVAKTKDALCMQVVAKTDALAGFNAAFSELVRSLKTGFTDSELQRAKDQMLAACEQAYNQRDKTDSNELAQELIRKFVDNEPAPGVEAEYQLLQQFLPMLPVQAINEACASLLTSENQVLALVRPTTDTPFPARQEVVEMVNGIQATQFEAYVDEVMNEPLIAKLPKKGKVKSVKDLPQFGAKVLTLSNGATVYVKTTDFAPDEIRFSATAPFGSQIMGADRASEAKLLPVAFQVSKYGKYDVNQLGKYLAGKNVDLEYDLRLNSSNFQGSSSVKDLENLMQLIYVAFTNIQPDPDMYNTVLSMQESALANQEKNPDFIFGKALTKNMYSANPMVMPLGIEDLHKADYNAMLAQYAKNVSNAADYDFFFVGNVDVETLTPLLEQYIASLPANPKKLTPEDKNFLHFAKGVLDDKFDADAQSAVVKEFVGISGTMPYSLENEIRLTMMASVLDMIYIRTLREELGGTYGASVQGALDPQTNEWMLLYVYDTNAKQRQDLDDRAVADLKDLLANGAKADDFKKVKEAALAQAEINAKKNGTWMNRLRSYAMYGLDATTYKDKVAAVTLEDLNKFMKGLDTSKNRIHVVLNGIAPTK